MIEPGRKNVVIKAKQIEIFSRGQVQRSTEGQIPRGCVMVQILYNDGGPKHQTVMKVFPRHGLASVLLKLGLVLSNDAVFLKDDPSSERL